MLILVKFSCKKHPSFSSFRVKNIHPSFSKADDLWKWAVHTWVQGRCAIVQELLFPTDSVQTECIPVNKFLAISTLDGYRLCQDCSELTAERFLFIYLLCWILTKWMSWPIWIQMRESWTTNQRDKRKCGKRKKAGSKLGLNEQRSIRGATKIIQFQRVRQRKN